MNFTELLTNNREKIIETCGKYGARNVRVFGSVVRGDADEKSDIDFLVTLSGGFGLFEQIRLEKELAGLLGHRVDIVSDKLQRPRFRDRVLKEAKPL